MMFHVLDASKILRMLLQTVNRGTLKGNLVLRKMEKIGKKSIVHHYIFIRPNPTLA